MNGTTSASLPRFTLSDLFAGIACFVLMFFLPIFFFYKAFGDYEAFNIGIGFGFLFCLLPLFLMTVFYVKKAKQKISPKDVLLLICYVLVTFSVVFNSDFSFTFIQLSLFVYLTGAICVSKTDSLTLKPHSYHYLLQELKQIFLIPAAKVFLPLTSFSRSFRFKKNPKLNGLLIGCLLAVPVALMLGSLLVSGDAAFNNASAKIFGSLLSALKKVVAGFVDDFYFFDFFIGTLSAVVFAPFVFSALFCFRHGIQKQADEKSATAFANRGFICESVATGFFVVICLLYLFYLLSQLSYFFGAFSGKIPLAVNMSLSEYARRGFFEMSTIAVINLALIAFGVICIKRKEEGRISPLFKGFFTFLCLFTMLLIATAMSKMALYITEMGLTHKRILVCIVDILLFVTLICVLIKLYKSSFPYMKIIVCTCLCVISLYTFIGDSPLIASFNTAAYLKGYHTKIDLDTIEYETDKYYAIKSLSKIAQDETSPMHIRAQLKIGGIIFDASNYLPEKKLEMNAFENLCTSESVTDFLFWEYAKDNRDFTMTCLNKFRGDIGWLGEY